MAPGRERHQRKMDARFVKLEDTRSLQRLIALIALLETTLGMEPPPARHALMVNMALAWERPLRSMAVERVPVASTASESESHQKI